MKRRLPCLLVSVIASLAGLVASVPHAAAVTPGDLITPANADSVAEQVSPGVLWCIRHGMNVLISPYKRIALPKAYVTATEQHAGQAKLGQNGRTLEGYVAGLPFPSIDVNDPDVANKIMWNYYYRPYFTDDYTWQNFAADTGLLNDAGGMSIERNYTIRHFGRLFYNGRCTSIRSPSCRIPRASATKS